MKIFTFILLITTLLTTINAEAQPNGPWVRIKNTSDKTFAEYQQEFYNYWEGRTPQKG